MCFQSCTLCVVRCVLSMLYVVLEVKGVKLKAHKVLLLSAQSQILSEMFNQEKCMIDPNNNHVKIDNIGPAIVEQMLEFIYTHEEPSEIDDSAKELMAATQMFQLQRLV